MNGWRSHIMQAWIMHSSRVYCHACISPAVTGSQCIFAIHCCLFVFLAKDLERKDALFFVLLKSFSLHWFPDTKIGPVPQGLIPVSFPSCGLLIFLSHFWILWVLCFYLHCSIYILLIVFICVCCVSVCVCVHSVSQFWLTLQLCSPPVSSVHEILQARILEWVAISDSRGASQPRDQIHSDSLPLHHWCSHKTVS